MTTLLPLLPLLTGLASPGLQTAQSDPADPLAAALALADQDPSSASGNHNPSDIAATPHDFRWQLELMGGLAQQATGRRQGVQRLSLDQYWQYQAAGSQWYSRLSSRFDTFWQQAERDSIFSLKELYSGYRWSDSWLTEIGRINLKNGVARGTNPTDFFAENAVRAVISRQPAVLREQRLGSMMVRQQWLGADSAINLLFSPRLASQPQQAIFHPDWARTNQHTQWQLSAEQNIYSGWSVSALLHQRAAQDLVFGLNLSGLARDDTVVYLEWASDSYEQSMLTTNQDNRLVTGFSYSLPVPLTVSLEWQYRPDGFTTEQWQQLQQNATIGDALTHSMPTRHTMMLQFQSQQWPQPLDWSFLWFKDLQDHSDIFITELTWLKSKYEFTLQWQHSHGGDKDRFGQVPTQLQIAARYYF